MVVTAGALSVVTDFYSVVLPMIVLLRLQMSKREKIGLMVVFSVGLCLVGAGIVRTIYLGHAQAEALDKSWIAFPAFAGAIAESNIAIICACAPSLRFLFGKFFRNVSSRSNQSKESKDSSNASTFQLRATNGKGLDERPNHSKGSDERGTDCGSKTLVGGNSVALEAYEESHWQRIQELQHHGSRRPLVRGQRAIHSLDVEHDPEAFLFDSTDSSAETFFPIQKPFTRPTSSPGY